MTLPERIDAALAGRSMSFYDLAVLLYPEDKYPRAWRHSVNGGPPGCYMSLSAGLRRGGFYQSSTAAGPGNRIVYPRPRP